MPGDVIKGHAKLESECSNCHVLMNKSGQDRLCLDCHKDVAADVAGKRGYHGRIELGACRSCHTDHKGRDARIVKLDERTFDHAADVAHVLARGQFGHYTAPLAMDVDLRGDDVRTQRPGAVTILDDRRRRLVARRLDAEDQHAWVASDSRKGGLSTPRSVTIAVM